MSIIVGIILILTTNPTTIDMPGWSHFDTVEQCRAAAEHVIQGLHAVHPDKVVEYRCVDVTPGPRK